MHPDVMQNKSTYLIHAAQRQKFLRLGEMCKRVHMSEKIPDTYSRALNLLCAVDTLPFAKLEKIVTVDNAPGLVCLLSPPVLGLDMTKFKSAFWVRIDRLFTEDRSDCVPRTSTIDPQIDQRSLSTTFTSVGPYFSVAANQVRALGYRY